MRHLFLLTMASTGMNLDYDEDLSDAFDRGESILSKGSSGHPRMNDQENSEDDNVPFSHSAVVENGDLLAGTDDENT